MLATKKKLPKYYTIFLNPPPTKWLCAAQVFGRWTHVGEGSSSCGACGVSAGGQPKSTHRTASLAADLTQTPHGTSSCILCEITVTINITASILTLMWCPLRQRGLSLRSIPEALQHYVHSRLLFSIPSAASGTPHLENKKYSAGVF